VKKVLAVLFGAALVVTSCSCSEPRQEAGYDRVPIEQVFVADGHDLLEKPFRLTTESGAFIDVGDSGGYAGPTLVDLDEDGDRDLVVGQFKFSHFRVFRNIGTERKPGRVVFRGDGTAFVAGVSSFREGQV